MINSHMSGRKWHQRQPGRLQEVTQVPTSGSVPHLRLRQLAALCNVSVWEKQKCTSEGTEGKRPLRERGRTASTADPAGLRLPIPTSLMTADLWRCFTYRTYGGRRGQEGRMRSSSQSTAGCGHASLCSEWDGSDPCCHESMDDKGINRVCYRATLGFYVIEQCACLPSLEDQCLEL